MSRTDLTNDDWKTIRALAKDGQINASVNLVNAMRAGDRSVTERLAIEIHRATNGQIPCWRSRPDTWPEGVLPPVLQTHGAAS